MRERAANDRSMKIDFLAELTLSFVIVGKAKGVTNKINSGSLLFMCPSKSWGVTVGQHAQ